MRLINADALNQYKFGEQLMTSSYSEGWDDAIDAIMKDAPTVVVRDNFDIGYAQGLEDGRNERPKGEWRFTDNRWGLGDWECNKCHRYTNKNTNFCPNCGAQMKKEEST